MEIMGVDRPDRTYKPLLLMEVRNPTIHQLRLVVEIPLFTRFKTCRISEPSTVVTILPHGQTKMGEVFKKNDVFLFLGRWGGKSQLEFK